MRPRAAAVAAVTLFALFALAGPAAAHEDREVGSLAIVVGLTPEPAVAGQPEAVQVFLTDHKTGKPVVLSDAELKNLAAHLFAGKLTATPEKADYDRLGNRAMPLHPAFDSPGEYRSEPFIATGPVDLTIHLATKENAKIHGESFNELFVSGEDTYGPMQNPTDLMFPAAVPTPSQLADKDAALTAEVADQAEAADQARPILLGIGVVAALGLVVGTLALVRNRRRDRVPDSPAELTRARP